MRPRTWKLKGPASILFGRIEPGGIIHKTTKRPLDVPYYSLEQEFGSYDHYRTIWDATGPLTGDASLAYRLSGAYQDSGSFRDFQQQQRFFISPSLLWRPTDATELKVDGRLGRDNLSCDNLPHSQGTMLVPIIGHALAREARAYEPFTYF